MHYQEKLLKQDISIATAGDNIVITPGAGEMPAAWDNGATYIVIDHINLIVGGTTTLQFKNGATTDANNGSVPQASYGGAYSLSQGQALVFENSFENEHGVITLSPNKSFVINLGTATQVSGFIRYRLLVTN